MKTKNSNKTKYYTNDKKIPGNLYMNKAEVLLESLPYIKEYFNI